MNRDRRLVASSLAAVVAVFASILVVFPTEMARATTVPPLAWGKNDHGQLGFCLSPQPVPGDTEAKARDPRCLDPTFSATPVEVAGLGDVTQLSAGLGHNLARLADGTVRAWGRNIENQLGDSQGVYYVRTQGNRTTDIPNCRDPFCPRPNPDQPKPGPVYEYTEVLEPDTQPPGLGVQYKRTYTPLTGVKAVAAGGLHSLAVKDDGTVWAWGESECGQLATGQGTYQGGDNSPPGAGEVLGLLDITAVAAGRAHSLALGEDGSLWAWGDNRWGQLGRVNPPAGGTCQNVPTRVPLTAKVLAFAAGSDHTLALTDDGKVWSWGNNCSAQLGSSSNAATTAYRSDPTEVSGLEGHKVVALAAGGGPVGGHSLALTDAGEVWAWGLADVLGNESAAGVGDSPCKGNPAFTNFPEQTDQKGRLTPAPVLVLDPITGQPQPLSDVVALDGGAFHTLAVRGDGKVYAWGRNDVGQLGRTAGPTAPSAVKVALPLDPSVASVSAGSHSLALPGPAPSRPAPPTPTTLLPGVTTTTLPTTTTTQSTTTTLAPTTTTTAPTTTTTQSTTTTTAPTTTTTTQPTTTTTTTGPTTTTTTPGAPPAAPGPGHRLATAFGAAADSRRNAREKARVGYGL